MFVDHLCEAKGEQDGEADKPQESFCELVIASGHAPIALDSFESFLPDDDAGRPLAENGTVIVRLLRPGMQLSRCPLLVEFLAFAPEENPLIKGTLCCHLSVECCH